MATAKTIYYSGDIELKGMHPLKNTHFRAAFGDIKGRKYDSFSYFVGHPATGHDCIMPVTRYVYYKKNPSLHKCDGRCINAKGHNCECSCGGANHGIGNN